MGTTSAAPAVKAGLVAALQASATLTGVTVSYSWPGTGMPSGASAIEAVFLGDTVVESDIPTMKAGRKHRQEDGTIDVIVWVIQPGGSPTAAQTTEARAYVLLGALEDVLANDPQAGIGSTLQWGQIKGHRVTHAPAQKGWGCQIAAEVEYHARLT